MQTEFTGNLMMIVLGGIFFLLPILLTVANTGSLIFIPKSDRLRRKLKWVEFITIILGILYSVLYASIMEERYTFSDWTAVLINEQKHTPLWREALPTVIVFAVCGMFGYAVLSFVKLNRMAPLVIVTAIAAMYLGVAECVLWIVQLLGKEDWILCLFPFNCIVIAAKTIRHKIWEWEEENIERDYSEKGHFFSFLNQKLLKAAYWPLAAFLLMWPLLGIGIVILALFGQQPDSFIKAWTETSDWTLSQRVSPPNVRVDEHYLCTVAAGGHKRIVKPIRMGERHGHRVVVNRQLCIANAFEQILEEWTPRFHKRVRHFYDTYGFPVARLIRSRLAADIVYYLMKPLEWLFLIVIYFCDVKPENRIAVQYLPKEKKDFL